jgi:hypothetical protein
MGVVLRVERGISTLAAFGRDEASFISSLHIPVIAARQPSKAGTVHGLGKATRCGLRDGVVERPQHQFGIVIAGRAPSNK